MSHPPAARLPALLLLLPLTVACKGDPEGPGEIASLQTRDGVSLEADHLAAGVGRPAVLLLHMIPPNWDRTSWPEDFLQALHARDWHVLALDRRGAGASGGEAVDAYEGEAGRYDVEAAFDFLAAEGATDIAILGASNGTTSMVDYSVWAASEGLPEPAATAFLTGGTYTENQTEMADFAAKAIPSAFAFSTAEREWSVAQEALDPGSWTFLEYPEGAHGTQMFEAAPEVSGDLEAWFAEQLDG